MSSARRPSVHVIGTRGYPSYYGGFETAVRYVAPFLVDAGWDVTVYGRPGQVRVDAPDLDRRVVRRTSRGVESRSLSTLTFGLTAVLDTVRRRPDVALVMNCANGYWLPLLRLAGVRSVVNVDGLEWERAKWGRLARWVFHTGARATARFADERVFDADAIGDHWRREFRVDGRMIPYGGARVDTPELHPDDRHLAPRSYVLLVARFVPENSVPEFLAAAERIARRHPVVLVGTTGYGGELDRRADALAARSANVHRLGHVSDDARLAALWHHAGAYFHGHSVGGTNPALVQAMHCGAAVVARDTVYNREVLDGTGAVFVAADPDAIADAVLDVLAHPERADVVRRRVVERARAVYTWERVCAAYDRVLRETAGRAPVRGRMRGRDCGRMRRRGPGRPQPATAASAAEAAPATRASS